MYKAMKRTSNILLLVAFTCFAATLLAQQKGKKVTKKVSTIDSLHGKVSKYARHYVPVYLGHSDLTGGALPKSVFDSLMKQGIYARDSAGDVYSVIGFNFSYAEMNLYEDSIGNLKIEPDYMIEHCEGNMVDANISSSLYNRTKERDTVYIDQVQLLTPDSSSADGNPMKFVITK